MSLTARLLCTIVLCLVLALLGTGIQTAYNTAKTVQEDIVSEYRQNLDLLAFSITPILLSERTEGGTESAKLKEFFENFQAESSVTHFGFRDTADVLVSSHDSPQNLRAPLWFARLCGIEEIRGTRPIVVDGVYYGVITLSLSPETAINQAWLHFLGHTKIFFVLTVPLLLLIWWILRRGLRPLKALAAASENFGGGNLSVRLDMRGCHELQKSIDGFNQMASQIETTHQALVASEKRFRVLVEQAPDAIIVYNADDGRVIEANARAEKLLGCTRNEIMRLGLQSFYLSEQTDKKDINRNFTESIERALAGEQIRSERLMHSLDGRDRLCAERLSLLPSEDSHLIRVSFIDITERKLAEKKLQETNDVLKLAMQSSGAGLWTWSHINNALTWSPEVYAIYGYEISEGPPTTEMWQAIVHPDDLSKAEEAIQDSLVNNHLFHEHRIIWRSGEIRWVAVYGETSQDADGKPIHMAGICLDITERKKNEEQQLKLESQLQQAQKMESIGRLAGGIAHDFNNMLSVILGHAELALQSLAPTSPICDDLKEIKTSAEHSANLTRQLLAFARKQTIVPKVFDLSETVASTLKMLERLIGEDILLTWTPAASPCLIKMDPSQIEQILFNLCVNSRDAIIGTGWITIQTVNCSIDAAYCSSNSEATPGDFVRVTISDSGTGMDKVTLKHIFEPFYTTKEQGKGTGLGLATVYGIVKQNNGFINVYSEPGKGTTFSIHIPRHEGTDRIKQEETATLPLQRGHETILLVEDEPAILKMAARMLEIQGYNVLTTSIPSEAISLAQEHQGEIHLLMTDVMMPEMNGRDLSEKILRIHPGMKRLFMSGYTSDIIPNHDVLEEGMTYFLQKPFTAASMASIVRKALDGD